MKNTNCIICGSEERHTIVKQNFKDKYLALISADYSDVERRWVGCKECGFIYHFPILDEFDTKLLYEKFRDESFRQEDPDQYFDRIISIADDQSENKAKVDLITKVLDEDIDVVKKVLDVGCGGGVFLYSLKSQHSHFDIFGLEPTDKFAELAARRLGCQIECNSLSGMVFDGGYDLITCNHVLEHSDDPIGFIDNLYINLNSNGFLYIEVPSVEDFSDESLEKDNDRFLMPHLWYFSPEILAKLFGSAGFELLFMSTRKTVIGKNDLVAVFKKTAEC